MKAQIIVQPQMPHQVEWCGAMARGLERHGVTIGNDGDFSVCWGWRVGEQCAGDVLVMERGHVGDRNQYASCGWNGLGRRGQYATGTADRWRNAWVRLLSPWRYTNGYALILGQCPGDMSLATMMCTMEQWAQNVTDQLIADGRTVVYRPHPANGGDYIPTGALPATASLADDLAGAAMAVTWNSTSAVEAVLSGVPTVTCDEGAMAWPVTSHSLDEPLITPDRYQWCADLAWSQFSMQEIESGMAWEHLRGFINGA